MPKILVLSGKDLINILTPEVLTEEIGKTFMAFSEGKTVTPQRPVMWVEGNWWGIMPSYVPGYGVGVKTVNIIPSNLDRGLPTIQALTALFDPENGSPLAIMEGAVLTGLRTAAATALSAKLMAPRDSGPLGIIGTGYQARFQLRFVSHFFKPTVVYAYDIRKEALTSFKEFAEGLGFKFIACSSPEEVVKNSKVIIDASTAKEPIILGKLIKPPAHVISISMGTPGARALDDDLLKIAESVVVDSKEAVLQETDDIAGPVKKGIISFEELKEIGEVVAGKKEGRVGNGVTVFKTVGLAVEDVAAAGVAYKLAKERNIGKFVEL